MARNKQLNEKMKDERRQKILSAAVKLFATKGLAATKITDIAQESEMSQGLVYHYYKSKEEIFTELVRYAFKRMNTATLELEKMDIPPIDKIKLAIEHLLKGLDENQNTGYYHLLIAHATATEAIPEDAKKIIKKENQIPYEVMTRIITKAQENGSINKFDPQDLSMVFWTTMKGLAIHKATHGKMFKTPDPEIIMSLFI